MAKTGQLAASRLGKMTTKTYHECITALPSTKRASWPPTSKGCKGRDNPASGVTAPTVFPGAAKLLGPARRRFRSSCSASLPACWNGMKCRMRVASPIAARTSLSGDACCFPLGPFAFSSPPLPTCARVAERGASSGATGTELRVPMLPRVGRLPNRDVPHETGNFVPT